MSLIYLEEPYKHWKFINEFSGDSLRIIPERGGLVSQWICNGREIFYFDEFRYKDPQKSIRGGMPVLFPICGNLPGNLLPLDKGDFFIKQHGFARDLDWNLMVNSHRSGIILSLSDNELSRLVYPYSFLIEMEICPVQSELKVSILIRNCGEGLMPFSFGLHPYFKVSDLSKVKLLGLPERCFNHLGMDMVETYSELDNLEDGVDFLVRPNSKVEMIDEGLNSKIRLHYQPPMDLIVVWTDPPRNMLCLEPWTSPRNSLVSGDRTLTLLEGEQKIIRCSYEVSSYPDTPGNLPIES